MAGAGLVEGLVRRDAVGRMCQVCDAPSKRIFNSFFGRIPSSYLNYPKCCRRNSPPSSRGATALVYVGEKASAGGC